MFTKLKGEELNKTKQNWTLYKKKTVKCNKKMSSSFINAAMYLHSIKPPLNELVEQGTNSVTDVHHRKNSAVSKGTYILE